MLGQLLGDFATRQALEHCDQRLIAGVQAHRALDRFTDDHPAFRKGCGLLETQCYRYAPVVMDVATDFFLVKNWSDFSGEVSFEEYLVRLYSSIPPYLLQLPNRMRTPAIRMREMDWFSGFAEPEGLATVFYFMARRVRKAEWIRNAFACIEANERELEVLCLELLQDDQLTNFSSTCF